MFLDLYFHKIVPLTGAAGAGHYSPSRTKMQARMAMSAPLLRLAGRLYAWALHDMTLPSWSQLHTRMVSVLVLVCSPSEMRMGK